MAYNVSTEPVSTWTERNPTLAGLVFLLGWILCPFVLILYGIRNLGGKYETKDSHHREGCEDFPYKMADQVADSFNDSYCSNPAPALVCVLTSLAWLIVTIVTIVAIAS